MHIHQWHCNLLFDLNIAIVVWKGISADDIAIFYLIWILPLLFDLHIAIVIQFAYCRCYCCVLKNALDLKDCSKKTTHMLAMLFMLPFLPTMLSTMLPLLPTMLFTMLPQWFTIPLTTLLPTTLLPTTPWSTKDTSSPSTIVQFWILLRLLMRTPLPLILSALPSSWAARAYLGCRAVLHRHPHRLYREHWGDRQRGLHLLLPA